tara:strand:+ start:1116 stop:1355 length:240 start_codon:yes stop_codon:yes gene_type:complete
MDINVREKAKTHKKYQRWCTKMLSNTRDKDDNLIILVKIRKIITLFESDIEYCVDMISKKYFFDSLTDAENFMQIKGGK